MTNSTDSNKESTVQFVVSVLQSSLGWTPELWGDKIQIIKCGQSSRREWRLAMFYTFAFVLGLVDAIFDFILAFQAQYGSKDGGKGLGILLGVMTILGRFIIGLYGRLTKKIMRDGRHNEVPIAFIYLIFELTVFVLEDGAAILLLAKSSSSLSTIELISLILTLTKYAVAFAIVFFGFLVPWFGLWVRHIREVGFDSFWISVSLIMIGPPTFMITILIQEVLVKDDDNPLSGGLELACYIVYGIGAFLLGLLSTCAFMGTFD